MPIVNRRGAFATPGWSHKTKAAAAKYGTYLHINADEKPGILSLTIPFKDYIKVFGHFVRVIGSHITSLFGIGIAARSQIAAGFAAATNLIL
jgi:hypothetical protein